MVLQFWNSVLLFCNTIQIKSAPWILKPADRMIFGI